MSQSKLCDVLVAIRSLSSLSVVINTISMVSYWDKVVGDCLRECTSLKKLSLTFNVEDYFENGFDGLSDGLATTSSLNTLSLAIFCHDLDLNFPGMFKSLNEGLSFNSSVTALTVTLAVSQPIFFCRPLNLRGLSANTSITTLSLTINEYCAGKSDIPGILFHCGVFEGLAQNTSVNTFNLTLNSSREVSDDWLPDLSVALKKNTSLTTLRLKVNNHCATGESRLYDFRKLVIESRSLSLLELDVSFYGKDSGYQQRLIQ